MNHVARNGIPNSPLFTIEVIDRDVGLEAYVCVHAIGAHGSSGGMRCVADISKEEVQLLARAMTFKYAFFGIQQGGAKAGLRMDFDAPLEERRRLIRAAARHLEPIVKRSSIWSVWTDMNFYREDLAEFYKAIDIPWTPSASGSSTVRTAITGIWSVEAYAGSIGLDRPRIAIEGYGGVAQYLATALSEKGYKITALSNHLGAVHNEDGLDIFAINSSKKKNGASWVLTPGNWATMPRERIFDIPVDVFMPGARVHSLNTARAECLSARAVIPFANVPCTDSALGIFDQREITYIPDYVVNGGGVCGWIRQADDSFGSHFKRMISRMLVKSQRVGRPPRELARAVADAGYAHIAVGAYPVESPAGRISRRLGAMPLVRNFRGSTREGELSADMAQRLDGLFL